MEFREGAAGMPPTSGILGWHSSQPSPPQRLATASTNLHHSPSPEEPRIPNQAPIPSLSEARPVQSRDQHEPAMTATTYIPDEQHANLNKLTFFQKYFTRPVTSNKDPEKDSSNNRRFSFLSIGFLVSAAVMAAILIAVIVAAIVVSVKGVNHRKSAQPGLDRHHGAPIRAAIPSNFPDPALYYEKGTWYAFATNNAAGVLPYKDRSNNASLHTPDFGLANIQMATSNNFVDWKLVSLVDQPLPATGNWTMGAHAHKKANKRPISSTWAPAVIKRADGKYVMYYAAVPAGENPYLRPGRHGKIFSPHPFPHCVGAAVSSGTLVVGPYEPLEDFLACPKEEGGAIDPEAMRDVDDKIWVTYKVDGNNIGHGGACGNTIKPIRPTPIMLQEMEDDGITKVGDPVEILTNIESDGPLVEAPMLIRSPEGVYFLFFSSGCTRENTYVVKYATSRNIKGPYTRAKNILLKTGDWGLEAPGSVGITEDGQGGWNMAFHARVNYELVGRVRAMFTTKLEFHDTVVKMVRDNTTVHLGHNG